jgi:hypothetical protein
MVAETDELTPTATFILRPEHYDHGTTKDIQESHLGLEQSREVRS